MDAMRSTQAARKGRGGLPYLRKEMHWGRFFQRRCVFNDAANEDTQHVNFVLQACQLTGYLGIDWIKYVLKKNLDFEPPLRFQTFESIVNVW
jgi:hypothetical protein